MPTVSYPRLTTISVPAGQILTVSSGSATGVVRRIDSSGTAIAGSQTVNLAANTSRIFGTFATPRQYLLEVTAGPGVVTYTTAEHEYGYATQQVLVEEFSGARTLCVEDNCKILVCSDGS